MLEPVLPLFHLNCHLLRTVVGQIDPADADVDPTGHLKTPRWQVGHMLMGTLYAASIVDASVPGPPLEAILKDFGPGSDPHAVSGEAPSMGTMLDAITELEQPLAKAVRVADASALQDPHDFEPLQDSPVRTRADMLANLLSNHFMLHLGELAMWRRARGIPPLF